MGLLLLQSAVSMDVSPFPPPVVGFMGLRPGYMIYGIRELTGYRRRAAG